MPDASQDEARMRWRKRVRVHDEDAVRGLARRVFPDAELEELDAEQLRALSAELVGGCKMGPRKRALSEGLAQVESLVRDKEALPNWRDANACNDDVVQTVAESAGAEGLTESHDVNLLALDETFPLYTHAHFRTLKRRFGREIIKPGTRRAFGGCRVAVKFKKPSKHVDCAVCGCAVFGWYVESNQKTAHMCCALYMANSEPAEGA